MTGSTSLWGWVASLVTTSSGGLSGRAFGFAAPTVQCRDADDFMIGDLRDPYFVRYVIDRRFDEIYQRADMGGAGYIFTGEHDAGCDAQLGKHHNILHAAYTRNNKRIFNPQSGNSTNSTPTTRIVRPTSYPAAPDSEYGWGDAQRTPLSCLWPQSRHGSVHCASSQYFRAGGWDDASRGPWRPFVVKLWCENAGDRGANGKVVPFIFEECLEGTLRRNLTIDQLVDQTLPHSQVNCLNKRHIDGPTGG